MSKPGNDTVFELGAPGPLRVKLVAAVLWRKSGDVLVALAV